MRELLGPGISLREMFGSDALVEHRPEPAPFTPARMTAGAARIVHAHAIVADDLRAVLGAESFALRALALRVATLQTSPTYASSEPAARLSGLCARLLEVVEMLEAESDAAASVAMFLSGVVAECGRIVEGCAARAA